MEAPEAGTQGLGGAVGTLTQNPLDRRQNYAMTTEKVGDSWKLDALVPLEVP